MGKFHVFACILMTAASLKTKDTVYNTRLNFRNFLQWKSAHYTQVNTVVVLREAH